MKNFKLLYTCLLLLFAFSCAEDSENPIMYGDDFIIPLAVGNTWEYQRVYPSIPSTPTNHIVNINEVIQLFDTTTFIVERTKEYSSFFPNTNNISIDKEGVSLDFDYHFIGVREFTIYSPESRRRILDFTKDNWVSIDEENNSHIIYQTPNGTDSLFTYTRTIMSGKNLEDVNVNYKGKTYKAKSSEITLKIDLKIDFKDGTSHVDETVIEKMYFRFIDSIGIYSVSSKGIYEVPNSEYILVNHILK